MIALSNAAKEKVALGVGYYVQQITMTLTDGTVFYVTNSDILGDSGIEIEDATSSNGSLDVGSAIINSCRFTLQNFDDKFTGHEYYGASLVVIVGIPLGDDSIEYVDKGRYTVVESSIMDGAIGITAYDNMAKFDRDYSESQLAYPATVQQIVADACRVCGVSNGTGTFTNRNVAIPEKPSTDSLTFRMVISWCAQIAGCFARIDKTGALTFKWYDVANIGNYNSSSTTFHDITGTFSRSSGTDDTVVTGLRAMVKPDENGEDDLTFSYGISGYVVEFSGNEFITQDNAPSILQTVGAKIVGMRYRRLEITHLSDPSFEAGDICRIPSGKGYDDGLEVNSAQLVVNGSEMLVSKRGLYYWGIVSYTKFVAGGSQTTRSDSEDVAINSAARYSEISRAIVSGRESIQREISARELAVQNLAERLATSSGLYITPSVQPDGSTIYYAHNKANLTESDIIWKFTAEAFAISTDGGASYPYGLDVSGTAILDRIYAVGIDADYITTGQLTGVDNEGNTVFSFNAETKKIWIKSSEIEMTGGGALDTALSTLDTKAGNAQSTANAATQTANSAVSAASNAQTTATNASNTANAASQTAAEALSTAQSAETNAKALVANLSRDNFIIPTLSDGSGGDYSGCVSRLSVQWGSTDVTDDADITINDGSGIVLANSKKLVVNGKELRSYGGDITSIWNPTTHTYTVTDSRADIAVATFTITYSEKTLTKTINVIKAMQGAQGAQGEPGEDGISGVSVISVDVWYYVSTSAEMPTGGTWSTNQPQWQDGKYIWFKTVTAYSNGNTTESQPACITGSAGYTGETGVGIDSVEEQYYLSTSETSLAGGNWSTIPSWDTGKFLWNRLKITYDDESSTVKYTDAVLAQAINDANQRAEDAQNELANMELGGVNLVRISNTLLFDDYYFYDYLAVNGVALTVNDKELELRIYP